MTDRDKAIEVMARAIVRAKEAEVCASDEEWPLSVAHHHAMVAKHGKAYSMGRGLFTDAFREAEAALTALQASGMAVVAGWQPIESAPKDGTLMWLLVDGDAVIGRFRRPYLDLESDTGDWRISALFKRRERPDLDDGIALTAGSIEPTRWMPLPALPASPDGKAFQPMGSEKEKGEDRQDSQTTA